MLGTQLASLREEFDRLTANTVHRVTLLEERAIREDQHSRDIEHNSASLDCILRLLREQNYEVQRVHIGFFRSMNGMAQDFQNLVDLLLSSVASINSRLDRLIFSNTDVTISIAALKAASDDLDREVICNTRNFRSVSNVLKERIQLPKEPFEDA
ncbi:hypothetical protein L6452_19856 [Arctium lappa]|uniref:Uncharacterized protein n=1 Tax=Arctium lappa TaxID=4217 RepID=A0ACB9B9Q0_ARCLA|nr:hypothetical protein L6452_19856 [Arctium lappa]